MHVDFDGVTVKLFHVHAGVHRKRSTFIIISYVNMNQPSLCEQAFSFFSGFLSDRVKVKEEKAEENRKNWNDSYHYFYGQRHRPWLLARILIISSNPMKSWYM